MLTQIHTEERLRQSEARLTALFRGVSDAIVLADEAGRVAMLNPAAELLLHCSSIVAAGQPLSRFLPIDPKTDAEVSDRQGSADGTPPVRGVCLAVDGGRPAVRGHRPRRSATCCDMEARLAAGGAVESMGLLAGGIAHDLNNVLAPIVLGLDLLARGDWAEPTGRVTTMAGHGSGAASWYGRC